MTSDAGRFRIGIVPEHFSLPMHRAENEGYFSRANLKVTLENYPRGTGSMCRALRTGELDVAVALTEGIISDIVTHGPGIGIAATYVASPLHWQISVAHDSPLTDVEQLRGRPFGISRFGSGSHLMTFLLAERHKWDLEHELKFEVKGGLADLLGGLADGSTAAFLWETFTVRPHSDKIRKIGEILTPWPCFLVVVRTDVAESRPDELRRLLDAIQQACKDFKQDPKAMETISRECHLSLEDARTWFDQTKFSLDGRVERKMLDDAMATLVHTGAIKQKLNSNDLRSPVTTLT